VFDQFTQLVSDASGWAYVILFALAFLDAIVPIVPSETSVITAGVVSATGKLSLPVIVVVAAAGAFSGDNTSYGIGRRFGARVVNRFFNGHKAQSRIAWSQRQLRERGVELIVVARFIPGGRTAVTLSAGLLHFRWRRFLVADAAAALFWALYASLLGYIGGRAFEHAAWKGLLLALGIGFAITGLIEAIRWLLRRLRGRQAANVEASD
jgi:membrane-associated protein